MTQVTWHKKSDTKDPVIGNKENRDWENRIYEYTDKLTPHNKILEFPVTSYWLPVTNKNRVAKV